MAFIRSVDAIAKKWAQVTPMRSQDYADGIRNPRRPWAAATKNAEDAYEAGVQKSIVRKAFGKGVTRVGDEKWQRKASTRGVANWPAGVAEAQGDFEAGFAPYHDAIAAVKLPPRYARRDPRNLQRVKAIDDALIAKKDAMIAK